MNRQYKLFFSWQSEDKKSRKTLDVALQNAVDALDDRGIRLEIDHSTLGESGMPSIDQTILRKIDACDIFLADVTPVATYQKSSGNGMQVCKDVPNPNVLLELGYAMSALGVGYVVIVAHQGNWLPEICPLTLIIVQSIVLHPQIVTYLVSVSAMLVSIHQKNIAQAFILERYFFVSIYPAVIPGTYLMVFLVVALLLCLLHQIYIQRS